MGKWSKTTTKIEWNKTQEEHTDRQNTYIPKKTKHRNAPNKNKTKTTTTDNT